MKRYFGIQVGVIVLALAASSFAKVEEQKCLVSDVVTVGQRNGVTVRTVSFLEQPQTDSAGAATSSPPVSSATFSSAKEKVSAHVYIPESDLPVPLILFSHSAIHTYQGTTDLLPFAMAMARAGAASIVLDRTIKWEPYDERANMNHSVMECASRWMLTQVRVDPLRIATSGNYFVPRPIDDIRVPHGPIVSLAGYGTMGPAERINTEHMMSVPGQMKLARWFYRGFQLSHMKGDWVKTDDKVGFHMREVKAEWLKVETKPDGPEMAAK